MTRAALLAAALALAPGCQRKDPPRDPADRVDPSQLVSRADDPPGEPAPAQPPSPSRSGPAAPPPATPRPPPPPLPDPLPGQRTDVTAFVGAAMRAAIADLDGDGRREIVLADAKQLRVVDPKGRELAAVPVSRGLQVLAAADLDRDGHAEVFAGWGISREHMDTKAAVTVHRLKQGQLVEETVLAPETTRQDVVAIVPMPDREAVLIAYFESKYVVASVVAKRGPKGWEATKLAQLPTATSYGRGDLDGDGAIDLVVGRVYGDERASDGDAFVLAPDGARRRIPTTRGLRALAVADTDGDGRAEVFLADGWHQNYGAYAHGQLTWARSSNGDFATELIEDTPGQYSLERLVPAAIDPVVAATTSRSGGGTAIVALGSHYVRAFARSGDRWRGLTVGGLARDIAVGDLDGVPGDELLLVGERSEIVSLRGVAWPP